MIIVGLDPSLTSFGIAVTNGPGVIPLLYRVKPGKVTGHLRLRLLLSEVAKHTVGCDAVVMEGLSFGSKGSAVTDLAGLHWLVRHQLWTQGHPYAIVPPQARARYLTGKGNASKDDCLVAAVRRFDRVVEVAGNDVADALTLAQMGAEHYGCQVVNMPKASTDVLSALNKKGQPIIGWPNLDRYNGNGDAA